MLLIKMSYTKNMFELAENEEEEEEVNTVSLQQTLVCNILGILLFALGNFFGNLVNKVCSHEAGGPTVYTASSHLTMVEDHVFFFVPCNNWQRALGRVELNILVPLWTHIDEVFRGVDN